MKTGFLELGMYDEFGKRNEIEEGVKNEYYIDHNII